MSLCDLGWSCHWGYWCICER